MNNTEIRNRIIEILEGLDRPGTEAVINYLKTSSYFNCGCYSHHKEQGGLAKHSLEVYEHMLAYADELSSDSIAVAALFHDLGKTTRSKGHANRSLSILNKLGFELTDDERIAIGNHHDFSFDIFSCPLRRALSLADCHSTGDWKEHHR